MTPEDGESGQRWKLPEFSIAGRVLELQLTGWPLTIVLGSFIALVWAIVYNVRIGPEGWSGTVATGCTVLLPIVISLLMAPRQKSEDHSTIAILAVRDLQELRRSQESILEDLNGIDLVSVGTENTWKIIRSREELIRENRQVRSGIRYWMEVSPTVANDVMEKYSKQAELLAEMEEWHKSEDQ